MLSTVDLNDEPRICTHQVDFHSAEAIERDWEIGIQLESSARLRQRLETSIKKRLGCASRPAGAFGARSNRMSDRHKQVCQRTIDAITNESADARSIIAFPDRIGRQRYVGGQPEIALAGTTIV